MHVGVRGETWQANSADNKKSSAYVGFSCLNVSDTILISGKAVSKSTVNSLAKWDGWELSNVVSDSIPFSHTPVASAKAD